MEFPHYVFEDKETADGADAYISQVGGAPVVGKNAKTGRPEPEKAKTLRWAIPRERLDGKWVFPVVPESLSSQYPDHIKNYFNENFPHSIEIFQSDWFPSEEDSE